jgi:formate hydrogenlyase transcriptional activator
MATSVHSVLLPLQPSTRRYEDLLRAITAIAGYRDIQTFRERFASELQRFITFDYVLVHIINSETHAVEWRMFDAPGRNDEFYAPGRKDEIDLPDFGPDDSPTGTVYASQKPMVIQDWTHETRFTGLRDFLKQYDIRSSCLLPLTTVHRRIGVFATGTSQANAYSPEDVEFLSMVADHLALALDSALNLEASHAAQLELARKKERLELVLDLTNRVVSNLELRDLLREVAANVRRVMKCDVAGVALPDHEAGEFRFYALDFPDSKGFLTEDTRIPIEGSPLGSAFRNGQVELRGQCEIQADCPEACTNQAIREGLKSGCFLPLVSRNRNLGVLALSRFAPVPFTPDEIDFLVQIARQVAIAVENALAYKEIGELKEKLSQEKLYLEDEIRGEMDFEGIVGQSSGLRHVLQMVETVAGSDSTVLLLGETGTGKELIARAIHDRSRRKDRTLVKLNCAAIPTGLLESELFGHERGAFTGAITQKIGRLELANQGTLFLDEVGDIPIDIQPKLLRALQEREFERLGSTRTQRVDVRLVAATNRNLEKMIESREFRSDLYYRLNVFPIRIPPLRERPEDIPLLVRYFTQKYARRMEKQIESIPAGVLKKLSNWHWPGNIRELENFIERSVILTHGPTLQVPIAEVMNGSNGVVAKAANDGSERDKILRILRETKGRVAGSDGAAARMGLKRTTLISRMKKLGIEPRAIS